MTECCVCVMDLTGFAKDCRKKLVRCADGKYHWLFFCSRKCERKFEKESD